MVENNVIYFKIYLDTDLKIILLHVHQNNYVGRSNDHQIY